MDQTDSVSAKKSRKKFLMVLAVFALPVVLAKLALEFNWLDYGVTNKGDLIKQELSLTQLGLDSANIEPKWLLLYAVPAQCTSHCEKALENIHNTYVALGKEMPRVTPVALLQSSLSPMQKKQLSQSQWQFIANNHPAAMQLEQSKVFIVDPLGNVVMSHEVPAEETKLAQFGKEILADMKKLLKYSRVG